jgi:hypothetical protein
MGDHLLAEAIALRIAARAGDALVAPALPFGGADFFRGVPGGVALSTPTLTALVTEMLLALHEGGATRLLIVNGHGGNIPAIEDAQRQLQAMRLGAAHRQDDGVAGGEAACHLGRRERGDARLRCLVHAARSPYPAVFQRLPGRGPRAIAGDKQMTGGEGFHADGRSPCAFTRR